MIWHITDEDEGIEDTDLRVALNEVQLRALDIQQTGYEEEEWTIYEAYGGVNDREFRIVAEAETLIAVLKKLASNPNRK